MSVALPTPATTPKAVKLTINLPQVVFLGIKELAAKHGRNVTEEIRRALSFWKYVDDQRTLNRRILTEDEHGNLREIVFGDY